MKFKSVCKNCKGSKKEYDSTGFLCPRKCKECKGEGQVEREIEVPEYHCWMKHVLKIGNKGESK